MKQFLIPGIVVAMSLIFMGSLWQLEQADLAWILGWPSFRFFFDTLAIKDIFAVRDFFFALMLIAFWNVAVLALALWRKTK